MKLIAIRHAETEWNLQGRAMGQMDSPLTARGFQQAKLLADRLGQDSYSALYSSDLGRAIKTAEIISSVTRLGITVDAGLRERDLGIFQGLTKEERAERFPVQNSDYRRIGNSYQIPQGESGQQMFERSIQMLSRIAEHHLDNTVVVITHDGFLMRFFEFVLGITPGNSWRFKRDNCAFNSFEYTNGRWSLVTWNDVSHLKDLGSLDDATE